MMFNKKISPKVREGKEISMRSILYTFSSFGTAFLIPLKPSQPLLDLSLFEIETLPGYYIFDPLKVLAFLGLRSSAAAASV